MTTEFLPISDEKFEPILARILRPLIRFLLRNGITYVRFIQVVRPLFVEVAEKEFAIENKTISDSRISVLTGIARRYIRELRNETNPTSLQAPKVSSAARLIALWVSLPEFQNDDGEPQVLTRLTQQKNVPSFEKLAEIASNDVAPRTLLDDLLERKLITVTEQDEVRLLEHAYEPDDQVDDLLAIFSMHVHDHLSASTINLNNRQKPFLDRSVYHDGLSESSIIKLDKMAEREGMKLLKKLYARAEELSMADNKNNEQHNRYRFGFYSFSDKDG